MAPPPRECTVTCGHTRGRRRRRAGGPVPQRAAHGRHGRSGEKAEEARQWWPRERWDRRGWPTPQTTGKHLKARRSRGEESPRHRKPTPPHPARLLPRGPPTLPARSLGLSLLPRHRADVPGRQNSTPSSPGGGRGAGRWAGLRAPGRRAAAPSCPCCPVRRSWPGRHRQQGARGAGCRQGARGGAAALRALGTCPVLLRARGGRAAGVGRLPRRRWPRECNYEV